MIKFGFVSFGFFFVCLVFGFFFHLIVGLVSFCF